MNYSALLQQLAAQFNVLADHFQPVVMHPCLYPRFSAGLFSAHAHYLGDYLAETKSTLQRLSLAVAQQTDKTDTANQIAMTDWLAQRLLNQIQALHSEAISWSLRHHDFRQHPSGYLYRQLLLLQQQRQRVQVLADEAATDDSPSARDERAYLQQLLEKKQAKMQKIWQKLQQRRDHAAVMPPAHDD